MQKLGQHFLRNKSAIQKIVAALHLTSGDMIIEIGPGHGELTSELLMANGQLQIVIVEKDAVLCSALRKNFDKPQITIVEGDALKLLPVTIDGLPRDTIANYKLVGNIPYYITGRLLRIVSELKNRPTRSVFTIQKEVAERIVAEPPRMNRLAASVQYWAKPSIIATLPASDFVPPPKVDSAIILLERKNLSDVSADIYYAAMRTLFAQPRKTILNNLVVGQESGVRVMKDKKTTDTALREIGINPEARPQNLTIIDIESIARRLF
jgi:16S rRNA (adenine1518-N6/adenine1519-N6)-dimethyltransferase